MHVLCAFYARKQARSWGNLRRDRDDQETKVAQRGTVLSRKGPACAGLRPAYRALPALRMAEDGRVCVLVLSGGGILMPRPVPEKTVPRTYLMYERHDRALKHIAADDGRSVTDHLRQAVEEYLERRGRE